MILNKSNEVFEYEGKKYRIGDKVVVNSKDADYEGLIGIITEICDGEDKDTDNETPDIYCNFFKPIIPYEIELLEKRFSAIFQKPRKLEDINFDQVIMAPEMIEVITDLEKTDSNQKVYIVIDDWAYNDEYDSQIEVFINVIDKITIYDDKATVKYKFKCDYLPGGSKYDKSNDIGFESVLEGGVLCPARVQSTYQPNRAR